MSWHYLPELVAEFSGGSFVGSAPSAPWKKSRTVERCSSDDKGTVCFRCFRSGTTSEPSTAHHGVDLWMSSLRASRASRSVRPGNEAEPTTSGICGQRQSVSFAKYDPATSSWKTFPDLFPLDISDESSGIWPKRGSIQSGVAFLLPRWERPISGNVSGSSPHQAEFPTPSATDYGSSGNGTGNNVDSRGRPTAGLWPTPNAEGGTGYMSGSNQDTWRPTLETAVQMAPKGAPPEIKSGKWWPTPTQTGNHNRVGLSKKSGAGLATAVRRWPTPTVADSKNNDNPSTLRRTSPELGSVVGGKLNPQWVEWLMGWPIGWTGLEPLEMDRFHEWLRKHGRD